MALNRLAAIAAMTVLGGGKPCIKCANPVMVDYVVCETCYKRKNHDEWIHRAINGLMPLPAWAARAFPGWTNWEKVILLPDEDD